MSKMWEYIRSHNLQNAENRREILADDELRRVFGKDKVTMFEMNKHLDARLTMSIPTFWSLFSGVSPSSALAA